MKSLNTLNNYHSKTILAIISLSCINLVSIAQAEVTLLVDDHIKVTAINGKAVNTKFFKNPTLQYTLQAGEQVITAKYDRLYEPNKDNHEFVRSANITISSQMDDNKTYHLVMPNQPEKYLEAKKYAQNPTLAIMDGSKVIASQNTQDTNTSSLLSGIGSLFGRDKKAVQVNTQAITNSSKSSNINSTNFPTQQKTNNPSMQAGNTLDQFMKLWLQATPEERSRIRSWVAE